ncbi:betaine/proline/choline family ABC transporter ATP-binding protein [Brevibacterium sp.]|uniref:quaternary amine ABC transporter ATP-binding protein n=1 Tax=Brevibacterium sp. TaxID=1701 RepID=UPI002811313E|nr:betaine/proline/choline family ABC transporter ATP-binding protein [Brevibacterium sp.]
MTNNPATQVVAETALPTGGGSSIHVNDLWKVYGPHPRRALAEYRGGSDTVPEHMTAVRGVSFDVNPGETFVVMGLSGSGKSTLIRCLTRLIEPTAGHVDIDGNDVLTLSNARLADQRRNDWAMVFQHFGLLPHRRVLQNVAYGLEVSGVAQREREERAQQMVETVGLSGTENKYPNELSGGMRQRVGLARALVQNPRLLLLDEPFSALDPLIRTDLQDELMRLARVGSQTSIFITHDLTEALKVGDRIAIMRDGVLVQVGTPEEIVLRPTDDYVRRFAVEAPRAKVVRAETIARSAPEFSADTSASAVLTQLVQSGQGVAIARPDTRAPYTVTAQDLLTADPSERELGDIGADTATVDADALLTDVMKKLIETGRPAIVTSPAGECLGVIDDAATVRALSVPASGE